ncbi:hypothetical protein QSU92_12005 [Microbacterium sp. ET2]|uniref:hypothetical protein n=1 Tax=Microbacterium albipurpureum TaxID=3050384 RepID=UPI00259D306F|nr:hypothetical protein [Microbacterium sp. ET2 (Ac-2212)]WJL94689.1 hypothetical protein QSU92_12005 [Microbacterium sp. ET2 (Ac-2212)]
MPTTQAVPAVAPSKSTPFFRRPFRIIRENARVYGLLNLAAYGLLAIGFAVGMIFPELPAARAQTLETDGTSDLISSVLGSAPLFALLIFAVNVFRLSLATIILPSLIVPFAGLAFFGYWAVETGITLVQSTPVGWVAMIPHLLTVLIELQAYVLILLGAYLLGRNWLRPKLIGAPTRRRGYLEGLKSIGFLSLPALALLVIGAIWEAYSLLYLVHPLSQLLL